MELQDFDIIIGDTAVIDSTVTDSTGTAYDLTGLTGNGVVFKIYLGSTVILTKNLTSGITLTDADAGEIQIKLTAADTAALSGRYTYSIVVTTSMSEVYTVTAGGIFAHSGLTVQSYCTPADVASQLRLKTDGASTRKVFSATTDPTIVEVSKWIAEAEDYIDESTHHAWRETTVTNEYHPYKGQYDGIWKDVRIPLNHRAVQTFSHALGDKLELFDFTTYVDLLADDSYVEGEDDDYYVDYTNGHIIFVGTKPWVHPQAVRVTYRYGESSVPYDIREACTKLVAIRYLESELYTATVPNGPGLSPSKETIIQKWQEDVDRILARRSEMPVMNL